MIACILSEKVEAEVGTYGADLSFQDNGGGSCRVVLHGRERLVELRDLVEDVLAQLDAQEAPIELEPDPIWGILAGLCLREDQRRLAVELYQWDPSDPETHGASLKFLADALAREATPVQEQIS